MIEQTAIGRLTGMIFQRPARAAAVVALLAAVASAAQAHHSFAMYDVRKTYILTGVVTRVDPNPNHLQVFVAQLNDARDKIIRDDEGEPVVWAVEMAGASVAAREGVTVNAFPRGTIMSVGLHPLRNGFPGGGRGESGLFKCPVDTPPQPGEHCDSVAGATEFGDGGLPEPTDPIPAGGAD
jgi:hypothetical protein